MEEETLNNLFIIGWGLSGGFGGADEYTVIKCKNEDEAGVIAWENACECYENYAGNYGLRDIDDIMEEEGCSYEEALDYYNEERESWLDYSAVKFSKEEEEKIKDYNYDNPYKETTDKWKNN